MPAPYDRLETSRLVLRRWSSSDEAPFAALNADPAVMRYFPAPMTARQTRDQIDRFERGFEQRGFGIYALERKDDGRFIGFTGLNPTSEDLPCHGLLEVGWRLARRDWNQGFATEAARACVELAFGTLRQEAICSFTAETNAPSRAVMRRIGMVEWLRFDHPRIEVSSPLLRHVAYRLDAVERAPAVTPSFQASSSPAPPSPPRQEQE